MTPKKKRTDMTPEELTAARRADYESANRRAMGQGGYVSNERVQARLRFLMDDKGISARTIAERSGVTETMIRAHYHGKRMNGDNGGYGAPLTTCRWAFEQAILAARFGPDDQYYVPSFGVSRRIEALVSKGYPYKFLAEYMGYTLAVFHRRLTRELRQRVRADFHREVKAAYDKLAFANPLDMGVSVQGSRYARTVGVKHGFVPAECWDWDTLDDPNAVPEWTGACGTEEGFSIHVREKIKVCQPCRDAHQGGAVPQQRKFCADKFREHVKASGLSRRAVADAIGKNVDTIHRWSTGDRQPKIRSIHKLCELFDCMYEDLTVDAVADGEVFDYQAFGFAIRDADVSMRRLSVMLGVSNMAVQRWASGVRMPTKGNVKAVCDITGHDPAQFYREA